MFAILTICLRSSTLAAGPHQCGREFTLTVRCRTVRAPLGLKHKFMKDPKLPERFAVTILEQLAFIRAELFAQRKLLIEILSSITKERRRKIKERTYDRCIRGHWKARELKQRVGFIPKDKPL